MLVFLPTKLDTKWHQWGNLKWIEQGRNWIVEAVLQVWADRCSHGTRTGNLLWGYHFNIREERCLIRKAGGAELKTSDKLISIQDPFSAGICRTQCRQFWLCFSCLKSGQMCFRPSSRADKETVSQEWMLDCLLHDQSLYLILTLSHRAQKAGRLSKTMKKKDVSLAHTMWHTLCQSRLSELKNWLH